MDIIDYRFVVAAKVHTAKEHNFLVVRDEAVAPARARDVAIHGYGNPAVRLDVEDVKVVEGHVFDDWEHIFVSAAENHELTFKESG